MRFQKNKTKYSVLFFNPNAQEEFDSFCSRNGINLIKKDELKPFRYNPKGKVIILDDTNNYLKKNKK